jgi:hypothetical protein
MGMMYAHNQEKAAAFLLKVLEEKGGRVDYSYFYDGSEETAQRLYAGMELEDGDGEWIGAEGVMDEAAAEMESQGFVRIVWLEGQKLADDEPAYAIELTEEGRKKIAAGKKPKFRNLDL